MLTRTCTRSRLIPLRVTRNSHWSYQPNHKNPNNPSHHDIGQRTVQIHYKNCKNNIQIRHVTPLNIVFGHYPNGFGEDYYIPEVQWHLRCLDHEAESEVYYSLQHIIKWKIPDIYSHCDAHKKYGTNY